MIYSGSLRVRVGSATRAASTARRVAADSGGYLAKQDDNAVDKGHQVTATLRVPSDRFAAVFDQLGALGRVQERSVDSADVTNQVVDLEGRLDNARVSTDRLRELLAKAVNVADVVSLEDRLSKRESDIESLTGQLEVVKDQTALATIELTLTERDDPGVSKDLPSFVRSLRNGAVAVANVGLVLLSVLGFLVPFLPFLVLAWLALRWWRRRRRRNPTTPGAPTPWSYPPPPGRPGAKPFATGPGSAAAPEAETVAESPGSPEA